MMRQAMRALLAITVVLMLALPACETTQESELSQEEMARMEIENILASGNHRESARRSQIEANIQQAESATSKSLRIFEKINEDGSFGYMQVGSKAVRNAEELTTLLEGEFKHSAKHGLLVVLSDKRMVSETTDIIEQLVTYCKAKNISLWVRSPLSRDNNPYRQLA